MLCLHASSVIRKKRKMKKKVILLFVFIYFLFTGCKTLEIKSSKISNQNEYMDNVFFEPNIFNNLKYNWNDYIWDEYENNCCNQISEVNKISINSPNKIYIKKSTIKKIAIPICISYFITDKRIYKYHDKEYDLALYIKKIGNGNTEWLKYPIKDKRQMDSSIQEVLASPPDADMEDEKEILIKKYHSISDEELNDGYVYGGNLTFNILDYIDFPIEAGKYEIYISRNRIESEHLIFEIIM